jgi:hypothetical protein
MNWLFGKVFKDNPNFEEINGIAGMTLVIFLMSKMTPVVQQII